MPLRLDRSFYSSLYEKFKQDHKTSGAFWSIKFRYVELYEYTMELEGQIAPIETTGEALPMRITITSEEAMKILEDHLNKNVFMKPVELENVFFLEKSTDVSLDVSEIILDCKPKPTA